MSSASSLVIRPRRPRGHRCVGVPVKEPLVLIGSVKADAEVLSVDASNPSVTPTARQEREFRFVNVRSMPDGFVCGDG